MSAFLRQVEEVFATAREGGAEDCNLAILVNRDGGIHMIEGSDWALESLRLADGATAAYRIHRRSGRVWLEARATGQCVLRTDRPSRPRGHPACVSTPDFPRYLTIP